MKKSTRNVIIIVAAAVLVLAIAAGVWAFLSLKEEEAKIYEYPEYDESGNLILVAYRDIYGNLKGSDNYTTMPDGTKAVHHYDENKEQIGVETTKFNSEGSPTQYCKYEYETLVNEITYTYYEDGVSLKTKAEKTYEGEYVKAVKEWYDEEGNVTETKNYLNDEEVNN